MFVAIRPSWSHHQSRSVASHQLTRVVLPPIAMPSREKTDDVIDATEIVLRKEWTLIQSGTIAGFRSVPTCVI